MKHGPVALVVIMILRDTAIFQVLFLYSTCAWNITTVEINVEFTYLKVKSAKCIIIRNLQCRSWSFYFGLGLVSSGLRLTLGLKIFLLFTSLVSLQTLGSVGSSAVDITPLSVLFDCF